MTDVPAPPDAAPVSDAFPVVGSFVPPAQEGGELAYSPDGAWFITAGRPLNGPGPMTIYDTDTWEPLTTLFAVTCAFSPDSRSLYLLQEEVIERYDLETRRVTGTCRLPSREAESIALSPSGSRVAVAIACRQKRFPCRILLYDADRFDADNVDDTWAAEIETEAGWPVFVRFLREDRIGIVLAARGPAFSEIRVLSLPGHGNGEAAALTLQTPPIPPGGDSTDFGTGRFFAASLDGALVAATTEGRNLLRVWRTADGSVLHDLRFAPYDSRIGLDRYRGDEVVLKARVAAATFSPDGTLLATLQRPMIAGKASVQLWSMATGEVEREWPWPSDRSLPSLAWDPRGGVLAAPGDHGAVLRWRLPDGEPLPPLTPPPAFDVTTLVVLPDNDTVLWAGPDAAIHCGSIRDGSSEVWARVDPVFWQSPPESNEDGEDYSRSRYLTEIRKLALHPGGKLLASAHGSGGLRLWDIETRKVVREFHATRWNWDQYDPDYGEPELDCVFTPDGRHLVTAGKDSVLRLWDVGTGEEVRAITMTPQDIWNPLEQVSVLPGAGALRAAVSDKSRTFVRTWDLFTGEQVADTRGSRGGYGRDDVKDTPQFCVLADGKFAVQSNGHENIFIYSLPEWELLHEVVVWDEGITGPFAASPVAPVVAVGGTIGSISLREIPSGREVGRLRFAPGTVLSLRFSPDGSLLAAGGHFGVVTVYDVSAVKTS